MIAIKFANQQQSQQNQFGMNKIKLLLLFCFAFWLNDLVVRLKIIVELNGDLGQTFDHSSPHRPFWFHFRSETLSLRIHSFWFFPYFTVSEGRIRMDDKFLNVCRSFNINFISNIYVIQPAQLLVSSRIFTSHQPMLDSVRLFTLPSGVHLICLVFVLWKH